MLTLHNRSISVPRLKLLESLRENQAKHASEYAQAITDYHIALEVELKKALKAVKAITTDTIEQVRKVSVDFDAPVSHLADYRKAIQMLEFSTVESIEVDEASFEAYVNNNWPWKNAFVGNALKYSALSGAIKR